MRHGTSSPLALLGLSFMLGLRDALDPIAAPLAAALQVGALLVRVTVGGVLVSHLAVDGGALV